MDGRVGEGEEGFVEEEGDEVGGEGGVDVQELELVSKGEEVG